MLPSSLKADLREHLKKVRLQHEADLRAGHGRVYLPNALSRKYPGAAAEWGWQYVFPAPALSRDPRSGEHRRHHLYDRSVQKAFHEAVRAAGISTPSLAVLGNPLREKGEGNRMTVPASQQISFTRKRQGDLALGRINGATMCQPPEQLAFGVGTLPPKLIEERRFIEGVIQSSLNILPGGLGPARLVEVPAEAVTHELKEIGVARCGGEDAFDASRRIDLWKPGDRLTDEMAGFGFVEGADLMENRVRQRIAPLPGEAVGRRGRR